MNKGKRVFVIWLSDLTTKVLKGEIKPTDIILIFAPENTEVQEIPFFNGQDQKVHQSLEDIDNIIKTIRIYAKNKNDVVYLVGQIMPSLYTEISGPVKKGIKGVFKSENFKVKEKQISESGTMMDTTLLGYFAEMQQNTPQKLTEPDTVSIPETSTQEPIKNEVDHTEQSKKTQNKNIKTESIKDSKKSHKNDRSPSQKKQQDTAERNGSNKSTQQQSKSNISVHKVNLSELEAAVFGSQIESATYEAEFTALQDLKARMLSKMYERLKEHIHFYTKKDFEEKKYFDFVILLAKTTSCREFMDSWSTMAPEYAIQLRTDEYLRLRGEASYYGKVCDLIYKEDVWNY